ncbi:MAG: DUF447 family protein [Euryarchaeota archaeon]|nr:DUF447 family protein [Euryarchaeota archaeon]
MVISLDRLGLGRGISETLVTTLSPRGRPNAGPMGIHRRGEGLWVYLYRDSRTFPNVVARGRLVVNVVSDPLLFVRAAFSDLAPGEFVRIGGEPVLREARSWLLCHARPGRGDSVKVRAALEPLRGGVRRPGVEAPNRGRAAVLEAAIAATRYVIFHDREKRETIERSRRVVERCGGPGEKAAFRRLELFIP